MGWQDRDRFLPAVVTLSPLLERLGVTHIVWDYNGMGDEGEVEQCTVLPDEPPVTLPFGLLDVLDDMLDDDDVLPGGYEINEGSYGTVTIDVSVRAMNVTQHEHEQDDWRDDDDVDWDRGDADPVDEEDPQHAIDSALEQQWHEDEERRGLADLADAEEFAAGLAATADDLERREHREQEEADAAEAEHLAWEADSEDPATEDA